MAKADKTGNTGKTAPVQADSDDMEEILPEADAPEFLDEALPEEGFSALGLDESKLKEIQNRIPFYNFELCKRWPVYGLLLCEVMVRDKVLFTENDNEVKRGKQKVGDVKMPPNYCYLVELLKDGVCARKDRETGKPKLFTVKKGQRIYVPVKFAISGLRQKYLAIQEDIFPLVIKPISLNPIPGTMQKSWEIKSFEAGPPVKRFEVARDTVGMIASAAETGGVFLLTAGDTSFDTAKMDAESNAVQAAAQAS